MFKISRTAKRIGIISIALIAILAFFSKDIAWAIYYWSIKPRKARIEIPVTYRVGWWPGQQWLTIDSFRVEIVESHLNLFNDQSLFAYTVFGKIKNTKFVECFIEEVHLSERLNRDTSVHVDRIVEITPVVSLKGSKKEVPETTTFKFRNELNITSGFWGGNSIKFICGSKEQIIEFRQKK
jgi:hypothetical protein